MKKLVICCASGIDNSGDEALLGILLRRYSPEYNIAIISLDAEKTRLSVNDPKYCYCTIQSPEARKVIKDCDIFMYGGGGLIQDKTSVYNPLRWLSCLHYAEKKHKKTFIYGCSIGELHYSFNRMLASRILSKVDYITLRDVVSDQLLDELLKVKNHEVTADPVFALGSPSEEEYSQVKSFFEFPDNYCCISIRHWYDTYPLLPVKVANGLHLYKGRKEYHRYVREMADIVARINDQYHLDVVFLSMCHGRDTEVARDVLEELRKNGGNAERNRIIDQTLFPSKSAEAVIKGARFLLGMRLHSIIYAINVLTPVIPIVYQDKGLGIVRTLDINDYHEVDSVNASDVCRSIEEIMKNRDKCVRDLEEIRGKMQLAESKNDVCFRKTVGAD
ncbi:MAG: polysaccharide pyruvyl transferase family protein [Lachnospiraceae bacterium]|nr:polysaccharide pyruvyl transferase family protein [Lachnospiraceae bacterium]